MSSAKVWPMMWWPAISEARNSGSQIRNSMYRTGKSAGKSASTAKDAGKPEDVTVIIEMKHVNSTELSVTLVGGGSLLFFHILAFTTLYYTEGQAVPRDAPSQS
ncbi:neuroligin-4, X-linked isoform X1 [Sigmodon hispidus]